MVDINLFVKEKLNYIKTLSEEDLKFVVDIKETTYEGYPMKAFTYREPKEQVGEVFNELLDAYISDNIVEGQPFFYLKKTEDAIFISILTWLDKDGETGQEIQKD